MTIRTTLLFTFLLSLTCNQYAEGIEDYYYLLSGTWRCTDSLKFDPDGSIEASWGMASIKGMSSDLIIDLSEDHQKGTYWGTTDGRWHIGAQGLHLVTQIEKLEDDVYKLYLDENWDNPDSDNPYLVGNCSGVVIIRFLDKNKITLSVTSESDEFFHFLSLNPGDHGYYTWVRTDGPQEEFQQEAN